MSHGANELGGRNAKHTAIASAAGSSIATHPQRARTLGPQPLRAWRPYGADKKHNAITVTAATPNHDHSSVVNNARSAQRVVERARLMTEHASRALARDALMVTQRDE